MRNMGAGKLENALAAQSVLKGLLANDALAAGKGALPARMRPVDVEHAGHARVSGFCRRASGCSGGGRDCGVDAVERGRSGRRTRMEAVGEVVGIRGTAVRALEQVSRESIAAAIAGAIVVENSPS